MVGVMDADWGMDNWYRLQDEADIICMDNERNADIHLADCINIATRLAPEYYNANGSDYYETDEEFLSDWDNWSEWLLDGCDDEDMTKAMQFWIDYGKDFTKLEWVLDHK